MTTLTDIIPRTLTLLNRHVPPVISDIVGQYFIAVKTGYELMQNWGRVSNMEELAEYVKAEIRWIDPDCPPVSFVQPARLTDNSMRCHALRIAVQNGYGEIVDALMRGLGVDISDYALVGYYEDGDCEMYQAVVGHTNFRSWNSLLIVASVHNLYEVALGAIRNGADCLDDALHEACRRNNDEIGTLLIRCGANSCMWHNDDRDTRWGGCFARVLGRRPDCDDSEEERDDDADEGDDDENDGDDVGLHITPK